MVFPKPNNTIQYFSVWIDLGNYDKSSLLFFDNMNKSS
jgi:hypothetical protein